MVSVSLRSIIHSYLKMKQTLTLKSGVSVSLRSIIHSYISLNVLYIFTITTMFPSPYGVSFILIHSFNSVIFILVWVVSVSLRSIIHSYLTRKEMFLIFCIQKVSVSLRSIIHSYTLKKINH